MSAALVADVVACATVMPRARASSRSFFAAGTEARQRGRGLQFGRDEVEHQQRGRLRIDGHRLQRGRRGHLHVGPLVDDGLCAGQRGDQRGQGRGEMHQR